MAAIGTPALVDTEQVACAHDWVQLCEGEAAIVLTSTCVRLLKLSFAWGTCPTSVLHLAKLARGTSAIVDENLEA